MADDLTKTCDGSDDPAHRCGLHHSTGLANPFGGYECCCGDAWKIRVDECMTGAKRGTPVTLRERMCRAAWAEDRTVDGNTLDAYMTVVTPELERLAEERDAARLVSKGRTMGQYDQEAELERLRAELADMKQGAAVNGGFFLSAEAEVERLSAELAKALSHTPLICCDERHAAKVQGLTAERDALKAARNDVAEAIRQARRIMTCHSRDWSLDAADAWLYALIVGWDCEIAEHAGGSHDEIDCGGPDGLEDFAERFGWTEDGIAKLRAQRQAIAALDTPTPEETTNGG
jgi:hypothetical protein